MRFQLSNNFKVFIIFILIVLAFAVKRWWFSVIAVFLIYYVFIYTYSLTKKKLIAPFLFWKKIINLKDVKAVCRAKDFRKCWAKVYPEKRAVSLPLGGVVLFSKKYGGGGLVVWPANQNKFVKEIKARLPKNAYSKI